MRDGGEPGVGGVSITLRLDTDRNGTFDTVVGTQATASDGSYRFVNLPPGHYSVVASAPAGFGSTTSAVLTVGLAAGRSVDDADFGFTTGTVSPATIGDRVWDDTDADGAQEPGEPGQTGVAVSVRRDNDGDGLYETGVGSAVTGANGLYAVAGLTPGRYRVAFAAGGRNATTPTSTVVTVHAAGTVDTADFGLTSGMVAPGSIGDRVWLDTDRDGSQEAGEAGVNGVTVALRADDDGDGAFDTTVATVTTSGDGDYTFAGVAPGTYLVVVTAPGGLAPSSAPIVVGLGAGDDVTEADIGLSAPVPAPLDVRLDKTIEGEVTSGQDMVWLLTVTNGSISPTPASLTVTDPLPEGLSVRSATGAGWVCTAVNRTVTCVGGGPLATGQSSAIRIVTSVSAAGDEWIVNDGAVAAAGAELTLTNNRSSVGRQVASPPPPPTTTTPTTVGPTTTTTTTTPRPPWLPRTGADSRTPLALGGATLTLGALLALATRRRSRRPTDRAGQPVQR